MAEVVSTQDLGTNMVPEEDIGPQCQKQALVLANDKEYLEAYFDICRLYRLKRAILYKSKEGCSESKVSEKQSPGRDIASINAQIQGLEVIFWQKVEEGQKRGVKFAIEEVTAQYKLEIFEKRVLLFFLFLEYCEIDKNVCTEDEVLAIFDTNESVLSRMRNFKYFMSGSASS